MPTLTATAYVRPDSLDDALAMLGDDAVAIAGGTAVILHPPPGLRTLIDVGGVLPAEITETEGGVEIGAMATLTAMLEHPLLADAYDGVVAEMLRLVGSPLLRNAATIGGHLGRGRISDVIPLLIALDASVTFYDGTRTTLPLEEFYAAERHLDRLLITSVTIPRRPARSAAAHHKLSRTHFDIALINAAARIVTDADGAVCQARVVVGETPALGARVAGAEAALIGTLLGDEDIAAAAGIVRSDVVTGTDSRASAEYRTQLAGVVVTRCLTDIRTRLRGER
jgi:carbon-monoxide dehydrogenase medium subunit